jgi:hypothetical protein
VKGCPVPGFVVSFKKLISEPTSNIAPKSPGEKYEGGKIMYAPFGQKVFLSCQVVGFPVPFFR